MLNPQPYGWEENGDIETEWLEPKFREDMQSLAAQMRAGTVTLVVKHEFATEGHLRRWVRTKYLLHDWLVFEINEHNPLPQFSSQMIAVIKKLRGILCYPENGTSHLKAIASPKTSGMRDRNNNAAPSAHTESRARSRRAEIVRALPGWLVYRYAGQNTQDATGTCCARISACRCR